MLTHRAHSMMGIVLIRISVVLFSVGMTLPSYSQNLEEKPPLADFEEDLSKISNELNLALQKDPDLKGAWLDVETDDQQMDENAPRQFVFRRVLDPRSAEVQSAAMNRLMKRLVPSGRYRIDVANDRQLPYSDLMERMQAIVGRDVRFPGCKVLGGTYRSNTEGGTLDFLPRFQVARDGQFTALVGECRVIIKSDSLWSGVTVTDVDENKGQKVLVSEPPEPDVNDLFAKIRQAIREEPALQGAWLDVNVDDQGYPDIAPKIYQFRRAFDVQRMVAQSAAMDKLINRLVPTGRHRVDAAKDVQLPLSQLVARLQQEIDIEPQFAGCSLLGATYTFNEDDTSFDLVLHGRIWKEKQADIITNLCRRLMHDDMVWDASGVQLFTADLGLTVALESPALGAHCYSEAMHHFWKMDYEASDHLLALASIEDPLNVVYRYWRVIGDLAKGHRELAETRLKKTVEGFGVQRNSWQHREIMQTIYRIQGPLRHTLMDAERKAMTRSMEGIDGKTTVAPKRGATAEFDKL